MGPALGGLLIAWLGASGNFFAQAAAYLGVFVMIYIMRVPENSTVGKQSSIFEEIREGIKYVLANPVLLTVIVIALIPPLFATPYMSLMPIFQKDIYGVGPEELGLLMGAPGLGAILSLSLLASIGDRIRRKGILLLGGLAIFGIILILFSRTTSFPLALIPLAAAGFFQLTYITGAYTIIQLITPDELRGRVLSIYFLDRGLSPLGAFAAVFAADQLGAPLTITIMGSLVVFLVLIVAWKSPQLRQLEL
ncbi:MAG: hypothetical protein A2Z14_13545 [Chloroflexi bacterium RBG_16_48_8]|nr:MAG: hypothetical protein A2Z14_13545 [Chloroflexi bacterium RBG_16_48_8]